MARRSLRATAVLAAAAAASTPAPVHAEPGLERVLAREYPAAVRAAADDLGAPEQAQARYDRARDLQVRLPGAARPDCRELLAALRRFAAAQVAAAEWLDRQQPERRAAAVGRGRAAQSKVERARLACPVGAPAPAPGRSGGGELVTPRDGEAFTGEVVVRGPRGATEAELRVDGRLVATVAVAAEAARLHVPGRPRPIALLEARFRDAAGAPVGARRARRVYLLPGSAWDAARRTEGDPALARRLAALAASFPGISAIRVADLAGGAAAGWNERALFPAASTVKLGVLAAALAADRAPGARRAIRHDLETIASWSSNLAANRLLRLVGSGDAARGREAVERVLRALGAVSSTYTGAYRVGTGRAATPTAPPLVSRRVTTALDLCAVLESLNLAAGGDPTVRRRTGLRAADARLVVGLLLRSQETGDNEGLLAPFLPAALPRAAKHGWLSSARHTAALLYGPGGPVAVVLLTYREGLTLREAQALGRGVARLALARAAS